MIVFLSDDIFPYPVSLTVFAYGRKNPCPRTKEVDIMLIGIMYLGAGEEKTESKT